MDRIMSIVDGYTIGMVKSAGKFKAYAVDQFGKFMGGEQGDARILIGSVILAIIAVVIAAQLGSAILPASITSLSNTSAISGYATWSSGTQNIWGILALFVVLSFLLVLVAIILSLI